MDYQSELKILNNTYSNEIVDKERREYRDNIISFQKQILMKRYDVKPAENLFEASQQEYRRRHYQQNKTTILENAAVRYICFCGANLCVGSKAVHERSKKHITYIKKITIKVQ